MVNSRVFYDLTGNENILNQLETLVSDLKSQSISGSVVVPDYAHMCGNITLDAITVVVVAYDEETLHKLYDFWDKYQNNFVEIRPMSADLLTTDSEIYSDYKGVLRYDF